MEVDGKDVSHENSETGYGKGTLFASTTYRLAKVSLAG